MASGSKYRSSNLAVSLEEQLANAVRESDVDAIQSLILAGADVNMASLSGKTPLSIASTIGNIKVLKALTQYTHSNKNSKDFQTKKRKHVNCKKLNNTYESKYNCNNLGYYIVVHEDDELDNTAPPTTAAAPPPTINQDKNITTSSPTSPSSEILIEGSSGSESQTPDDMDKLEWDVEVKDEIKETNKKKTEQNNLDKDINEELKTNNMGQNKCCNEVEEEDDEVVVEGEEEIWSSQYKWYAQILDKTCSAMMDNFLKTPKHVCDLDHQDTNGLTALHYATDAGQTEVVQFLINEGCRVDIGEIENLTALHLASSRGRTEIVTALIKGGANINRKTSDKMSPLHYAAARGFVDTILILINSGASIDTLDSSDRTPLYLAVNRGQIEATKVLIQYGARVNIEEVHCYTPLCEGVWLKSVEMVEVLLNAGAKVTHSHNLLHYAILHRHFDMVVLLLRAGSHINKRGDTGETPLILAAKTGQVRIAELLLKQGAAANFSNAITGSTPLHEAIENIRECDFPILEQIFELLIRNGANIDTVTWSSGDTPLNRALLMMAYHSAALLIRSGADPDKCDKRISSYFLTVSLYDNLGLARRRKKFGIVQMLVYAGYNLQKKTPDITYPEDWSNIDTSTIQGWLTYRKYNPMSLMQLTRLKLRKYLIRKTPDINSFIQSAQLPSSVKTYLMLKDIDYTMDEKSMDGDEDD